MTIEQISVQIFGTKDYQAMLSVLAPSSALVRQFYTLLDKYHLREDDDTTWQKNNLS